MLRSRNMEENRCSSFGLAEELLKNRKVADPATHILAEVNFLECQNQKEASRQIVSVKEWYYQVVEKLSWEKQCFGKHRLQVQPKGSETQPFFFCSST